MIVAHKIAPAPNNQQATYFAKAAWKADHNLPKPSQQSLRRQLNAIKREQFPWMLEGSKNAPQMAIIQLGAAFKNFWAGRAKYPKFRKKGVDDRFPLTNDQFSLDGRRIRIPHLGWVRMREALRFTGKLISATVSRMADRWFISITVAADAIPLRPAENQGATGVDLGVSAMATLSTRRKGNRSQAAQGLAQAIAETL